MHPADRRDRQLLMRLFHGKTSHPIAKVVEPLLQQRRSRLDPQPIVDAGLLRRVAGNQMHLVVADRHALAVGVDGSVQIL